MTTTQTTPSTITVVPNPDDPKKSVIVTTPAEGVRRIVPTDHRATTPAGWYLGDGKGHVRDFIARGDGDNRTNDEGDMTCRKCHTTQDVKKFPTYTVPRKDGRTRSDECRACRDARVEAAKKDKADKEAKEARKVANAAKRAAKAITVDTPIVPVPDEADMAATA